MTFKVEVNYVEIDAVVTDAQGNFVRTLTKDDFQVFEQGKPQTVANFSLVDIPVEKFDPPLYKVKPIEPDVRSNRREFDGRVFVLVLDDLNTLVLALGAGQVGGTIVHRAVPRRQRRRRHRPDGRREGTSQEFTSSRERLIRAVDRFMGQKERSPTLEKIDDYNRNLNSGMNSTPRDANEAIRVHKARNTLTVLKNVADYMAGIRGRRKAVVFFSEGIDYNIYNQITNVYATDIRGYGQDAIAAATRANVSFYSVDPRGLSGVDDAAEISSLPRGPDARTRDGGSAAGVEAVAGQPSDDLRRDRRFCRGQFQRLPDELRADHPRQQQLLRARVLLERLAARRPVPHA